MEAPSADQSLIAIQEYAVDTATILLLEHGQVFETSRTQGQAYMVLEHVKKLVAQFDSFIQAAAAMMQNNKFFYLPEIETVAHDIARMLLTLADDLYYDSGDAGKALQYYQLAAGLSHGDELAVRAALSPCLQGDPPRPKIALPYAVYAAHLNPKHRKDVAYVLKLIDDVE